MKGLFIPDITAEMFRNGCLESIEALMAEGEIYDIEYSPWIPVSEEPITGIYLVTRQYKQHRYVEMATYDGDNPQDVFSWEGYSDEWKLHRAEHKVLAWKPAPEPYKEEEE